MSLAGLAIVAVASWSFASGLSRELRLAHAEPDIARVAAPLPKPFEGPSPQAALAYVAPVAPPAPAPKPVRHARRHLETDDDDIFQPITPAPPAPTPVPAPDVAAAAVDAASKAPATPAPAPSPSSPPADEASAPPD